MTFKGVSPDKKRSHIKILNNKGPKIDPCGTPNKISSQEL